MTRKYLKSDYRLYYSSKRWTITKMVAATVLVLFIALFAFLGTWQKKAEVQTVEISIAADKLPIRLHPQTGIAKAE